MPLMLDAACTGRTFFWFMACFCLILDWFGVLFCFVLLSSCFGFCFRVSFPALASFCALCVCGCPLVVLGSFGVVLFPPPSHHLHITSHHIRS